MSSRSKGTLFIVSAPSGTGKTTLVERLVHSVPDLTMSRSYTSRVARSGERDGTDYNFISRERFEAMIRDGALLEYADVFGNFYGTGRADTDALLAAGQDVVLVIDVQGARQVRRLGAASTLPAVGIFVLPPSFEVLERRLRGRSKDSEEQISRRLHVARQEVGEYASYDYVVVNDELDTGVDRLRAIVLSERARMQAMREQAEKIIGTFGGTRGTST
jgi:guanylate kinase